MKEAEALELMNHVNRLPLNGYCPQMAGNCKTHCIHFSKAEIERMYSNAGRQINYRVIGTYCKLWQQGAK